MVIIQDINSDKFSLDGISYLKNFLPVVNGSNLKVVNTYDSKIVLSDYKLYSEYTVNGVVYDSISDLQDSLLDILYSRIGFGVDLAISGKTDKGGYEGTTQDAVNTISAAANGVLQFETKALAVAYYTANTPDNYSRFDVRADGTNNGEYYFLAGATDNIQFIQAFIEIEPNGVVAGSDKVATSGAVEIEVSIHDGKGFNEEGFISKTTGEFTANSGYFSTPFLKYLGGDLTITGFSGNVNSVGLITFYDKNKTRLGVINESGASNISTENYVITEDLINSECLYIKASAGSNQDNRKVYGNVVFIDPQIDEVQALAENNQTILDASFTEEEFIEQTVTRTTTNASSNVVWVDSRPAITTIKLTQLRYYIGTDTGAGTNWIGLRTYEVIDGEYVLYGSIDDILVTADTDQLIDLSAYEDIYVPKGGLVGVFHKYVRGAYGSKTGASYQIANGSESGTLPTLLNFEFAWDFYGEGNFLPYNNEIRIEALENGGVQGRFTNQPAYFFGDSITFGTNGGYVDYINDLIGCLGVNRGSSGANTGRLVAIMTPIKDRENGTPSAHITPDYTGYAFATIMIGTNDGVSGTIADANSFSETCYDVPYTGYATIEEHLERYPNTYYGNMGLILDYVQFQNAEMEIFLIDAPVESGNPLQHGDISKALNELQEIFTCKRIHASVESGISYRNFEPTFSYDGTHFTTEGNKLWGTCVAYDIKKYN